MKYTLKVNGEPHEVDVDPETPLLWVIREDVGLTGTKYSCGIAACGACTVHLDGEATRSCVLPIDSVGDAEITTIEGLSTTAATRCSAPGLKSTFPNVVIASRGQIMAAVALLEEDANPSDDVIRETMTNICRCGTYNRILKAIKLAAEYKAEAT